MTQIVIDTNDSRDVKALELAATAGTWETMDGAFLVPSSDGKRTYVTTAETCTCEDNGRGNVCKHRRAAAIYVALREASQPKLASVARGAPFPVAVRDGDETVFLSRREARRRGIATEHYPRLCGECAEAEEARPTPSYRLEGEALWARFKGD
jgi:hypothetical protein